MRRQAQELGHVRLRSNDPPVTVTARLSDQRPNVDAGYGGWSEVARPRRSPLAVWVGAPALRMTLPLLLDEWRTGSSVEPQIAMLERLATATASDGQPPRVRFTARGAAVPHQNRVWVIDNLTWGDALMNRNGNRARQQVNVQLLEYVTDVPVQADAAATRQRAKASAVKSKAGASSKRVVAARGLVPNLAAIVEGTRSAGPRKVEVNLMPDPNLDEWDGQWIVDGADGMTGTGWWVYENGRQTNLADYDVYEGKAPSVKVVSTGTGPPEPGFYNWAPPLEPVLVVGQTYRLRVRVLIPAGQTGCYLWFGTFGYPGWPLLENWEVDAVGTGAWQTVEGTFTVTKPDPSGGQVFLSVGMYVLGSQNVPGKCFNWSSAELVYADAQPAADPGSGEDLLSIAARELGDADRWVEIAALNGIRDPRAVKVGQVIRLP